MSKLIAMKTLYFGNKVQFTRRGKTYTPTIRDTAKTLHNLKMEFLTEAGDKVSFSDNPEDEMYIDNVLQDYEKVKVQKENERLQQGNSI